MNPRFTISSGPFNVPMVEHVIIVRDGDIFPAPLIWEKLLRPELYAAFPHLENTKAYTMAPFYDEKSRTWQEQILVFIECDPEILKEICGRLRGQYIDVIDRFEESACCTICESCKWMIDEPKEEYEFPCSKCIHNYWEGSV